MSSFTRAEFDPVPGERWGGAWLFGWTIYKGRRVYVSRGGFRYDIGFEGSPLSIHVPAGFRTDFASIPWWLIWLVPRWVLKMLAVPSAVHDRLREELCFSLRETDCIYYLAMATRKVPRPVRWAVFLAVRTNKSRIQHNHAEQVEAPHPIVSTGGAAEP